MLARIVRFVAFSLGLWGLSGCGGDSAPATYPVGGAVSGLAGSGLTLLDNGGNALSITTSGSFAFPGTVASGAAYAVTVQTQPNNPSQTCAVTNASGTVTTAAITNVTVACTTNVYTIGGTISGLTGSGLVLQDNGGANLSVAANGAFTFATRVPSGKAYDVTVQAQPQAPAQNCVVSDDSGTASANVTNVLIACAGDWIWMSGSNIGGQSGMYGTLGTAAPGNVPGARYAAVSWVDTAGNFWLFGGNGPGLLDDDDAGPGFAYPWNDLWEYTAGQWTWVSGSNIPNQLGTYGTQGTAAPGNVPGARDGAVSWIDAAGNLWLFGGNGVNGLLNDLWKYSAGQWTWVSGSNQVNEAGTYGTLRTAAPGNVPGARYGAVSWIDAAGALWLFGGQGYDSTGNQTLLNDLWKYSAGQWTWVSGSNVGGSLGTYGTQGTAAPGNVPGARDGAVSWIDAAGNFWLFGGTRDYNDYNDLWKYSAGEWTWVSGSNLFDQPGTYGTQGTAAPGNAPGARYGAVSWIDAAGNLWLFGGVPLYFGLENPAPAFNDLWKYGAGQWTWVSGSNSAMPTGVYGTRGTAAFENVPGGRAGAVGWADATGNLWLFGGEGFDSNGEHPFNGGPRWDLNDLWKINP